MTARRGKDFLTLGIETSCDDTALAVTRGREVLSSAISSQTESHGVYGGVVPELASRMHQEAILPLLEKVLSDAAIKEPRREIDLIAVTAGPGLIGSLIVGVTTAKGLSQAWGVPLIGVNHLEGHIFANVAASPDLEPPFISLIVSGGHTEVVLTRAFGDYALLGSTRDDAAGEAYDKVSKAMGLSYPGGPVIDAAARGGDPDAFPLPVPLSSSKKIEFSFSGLKTATVALIEKNRGKSGELPVADICASFQKAVTAALLSKVKLAVKQTGVRRLTVSGGVAANSALRAALSGYSGANGIELFLPPRDMCTDNAVMIAAAGANAYKRGKRSSLDLSPDPSWEIW